MKSGGNHPHVRAATPIIGLPQKWCARPTYTSRFCGCLRSRSAYRSYIGRVVPGRTYNGKNRAGGISTRQPPTETIYFWLTQHRGKVPPPPQIPPPTLLTKHNTRKDTRGTAGVNQTYISPIVSRKYIFYKKCKFMHEIMLTCQDNKQLNTQGDHNLPP